MASLRLLLPMGFALAFCLVLGLPRMAPADPGTTERARRFLAAHEEKIRPLQIASQIAWWNASVTGKDEDFKVKEDAENRVGAVLSNRMAFQEVQALHKGRRQIDDPVLARAIEVVYLAYLEKQADNELLKKIVARSNAVEKAFNNYRAMVDGKEMTDSEVRQVLKSSRDSERRQSVWQASKGVGKAVEADLKELVKLRNLSAAQLGFDNYHQLMLHLNEQNGQDLLKLFDELDELTRGPFHAAKAEIDQKLAANCGVKVSDLMPWHYHDPFFQESPAVFSASLDAPFARADILQMCRDFYAGIGLPIDDVIARSDLYEKPGKSPHAFCSDIDHAGDVRVLANIVPNDYWMGTMLHELGHAVYSSKFIPRSLPYTLRTESHILTTEGVAMMFERFARQRSWLEKMGVKVENPKEFDETAAKVQRNQLLIFSRWCQVMLRFEKAMYENPDQDLNKLWWDLVEKYQEMKRPAGRSAPDYASKIHLVVAPVYYHNYMMGQLFASQLHHTIAREVLGGADPDTALYNDNKKVGEFMKQKVFGPGKTLSWNALTKFATGSDLNARAFAADFKD